MYRGILMRLSQAVPVLLIFSVMVFMLMHLLPGDPAQAIAGPDATPEAIEKIREHLGLNRPLLIQLLEWFSHLAVGNFGSPNRVYLNDGTGMMAAVWASSEKR